MLQQCCAHWVWVGVQLVCRQLKVIANKVVASHHSAATSRLVDGSAAAKCWVREVNTTVAHITAAAAAAGEESECLMAQAF
jgi:hypothetical protein